MGLKLHDVIMLNRERALVIGLDKTHVTVLVRGKRTTYPLKKGPKKWTTP